MLGERQKAAATELAQWWDGMRQGGTGSHAVLLAGPPAGGGPPSLTSCRGSSTRLGPRSAWWCVLMAGRSRTDPACRPRLCGTACSQPRCGGRQRRCCAAAGCAAPRDWARAACCYRGSPGRSRCFWPAWRRPLRAAWRTTARPARMAPPPGLPGWWQQCRHQRRPWWSLTTLIAWTRAWPSP